MESLIYVRFSKLDQERGHSIERQLENARSVCAQRGYTATAALTFIEKGKSAFSGANRAKGSLLANLETEITAGVHHGRVLVVEHLDRISRQGHREITDFLRTCSDNGVSVATFDGNRFYPAGERVDMMSIIEIILKSELAREESSKKSTRVRTSFAAKREAAKDGLKVIASRPPAWIRKLPNKAGFEIIEEAAEIVREAHRMTQAGFGTSAIARAFNERNIPPWQGSGKGWHESYIAKMLTARTVIGEYVSPKYNERILGYYPPIITVDEYNRSQAAREGRRVKSGGRRGHAQSNLFQGFIRCGHCDGSMSFQKSRVEGKTVVSDYAREKRGHTEIQTEASYLRCATRYRRLTNDAGELLCDNLKTVRYERLEPAVLSMLATVALDNDRFNQKEVSETRVKIAEIERQIEHEREGLANLAENLKTTVSPTLMSLLTATEDRIRILEGEREILARSMAREAGSEPSAALLARVRETLAGMRDPNIEKRREARTIVHSSLKDIITGMWSDSEGNTLVIVALGVLAFRVNNAGEVDWVADQTMNPSAMAGLESPSNKALLDRLMSSSTRRDLRVKRPRAYQPA